MFIYLLLFELISIEMTLSYKISALKCQEFNKQFCQKTALPLIVGGTEAKETEFPHMALVGYGKYQIKWDCGGALISEKFVLTAAHCAKSKENGKATSVMLGTVSKHQTTPNEIRKVSKITVHPKYKRPLKYNDIALIKLDSPIKFNEYVRPICLNFKKPDFSQDHMGGTAIGFGKTSFTNTVGSNNLLQVDIPILQNSICEPYFSTSKRVMPEGVIKSMICGGTLEGGKDTCQGDSGGPLQIYSEDTCSPMLIGVISFGKFCGYAKSPSIYTNVYYYIPWIEKHVWN